MKSVLFKSLFLVAFMFGGANLFASEKTVADQVDQLTDWQKVLVGVVNEGRALEMDFGYVFFSEETIPADKNLDHISNYLSVLVSKDSNGQYSIFGVFGVWENWTTDANGNWAVDQWHFELDMEGNLVEGKHWLLIETKTGQVLSDDVIPTEKEEFEVRWSKLREGWLKRNK